MRLPSPAMVVACIALAVALTGTAFAAVNFAQNAGAVDGKSAVASSASRADAAGKLLATQTRGEGKGQIPLRFVEDAMRGGTGTLNAYLRTVDNSPGTPRALAIIPGIGRLDATCGDVDQTAGIQATRTSISFTGSVPQGVNVSRVTGTDVDRGAQPDVFTARRGQTVTIITRADPLFQLTLEAQGRTVFITGAARSDRSPGPKAACLIWGLAFRVG